MFHTVTFMLLMHIFYLQKTIFQGQGNIIMRMLLSLFIRCTSILKKSIKGLFHDFDMLILMKIDCV